MKYTTDNGFPALKKLQNAEFGLVGSVALSELQPAPKCKEEETVVWLPSKKKVYSDGKKFDLGISSKLPNLYNSKQHDHTCERHPN